jgi:hypothetical protein
VLATLGNVFVNNSIYQQPQGIAKKLELRRQPLQNEQPILRIANQANQQENKLINAKLTVPFHLKVNQVATIKSENLKIKFLNVTSDSRCPADVNCIWQGEVTIIVNLVKNGQNLGNFSLSSLLNSATNVNIYSLKLTNVSSGPVVSGKPIKISDYVVTLVVSKI